MKEIPESEIQAKFFADTGENRGEILAKHFADFRRLISRKSGRKKFHEKSCTFSTRDETKFFHREILGVGGHNKERKRALPHKNCKRCHPGLKHPGWAMQQIGGHNLRLLDEAESRALSGPVLRDTARLSQRYPPIARYGVFGVTT